MLYRQSPIQPFQDHRLGPGVAGPFHAGQQLQSLLLELDGVVPGHPPAVLEAQDLLQANVRLQRLESRLGTLGRHLEMPVESRQELPEHYSGLFHGGCPSLQPEFGDQPVLEGPSRPLHSPLGLRRQGENQLYAQSSIALPNWVGVPAG